MEIIAIAKLVVLILTVLLVFIALVKSSISIKQKMSDIASGAGSKISRRMKNTSVEYFKYDRIAEKLSRLGVSELFDAEVTPVEYLTVKLLVAVFGFCVGMSVLNAVLGVIIAVVIYVSVDGLIKISNTSDNEAMLTDIKVIYDTLCIQTKAGVYMTNALGECYLVVKNKRLKKALLQLNNHIIATKDIEGALDEFNLKFDNTFIDTFCITIRQSLSTGQASQILSDIATQVSDIQNALNIKEQQALDRKIQFIQMATFVGVIAIVLFALMTEVGGVLSVF